jgi:hypothetical protein
MTRVALNRTWHIVCLAVLLSAGLVRPAEPVLSCNCVDRLAASVLPLPVVCRLAHLDNLALSATEHVLTTFTLI